MAESGSRHSHSHSQHAGGQHLHPGRVDLSTGQAKIGNRRPLSATIDASAKLVDGPSSLRRSNELASSSPSSSSSSSSSSTVGEQTTTTTREADRRAAQRALRRSASFDRRERFMNTKAHHSTTSLNRSQESAKQARRKSAGFGQEQASDKDNKQSQLPVYNKKKFNFELEMDTLLEDVSFDFNSNDAMLVVRSPSVRPRHSELTVPAAVRGSQSRPHSGHLSQPGSSDEESGSLNSPSSGRSGGIGFDMSDPDFQGEVYSRVKRKGSGGRPKEKELSPDDDQNYEITDGASHETRGLLFNFRDLSLAATNTNVVPGVIFRSAALTRAEVLPEDVHRALVFLRKGLNIKTIIDLRAKDEKSGDKLDWIVEKVYPTIKDPTVTGSDWVKRFNISFLNRDVKLKGLFWPCPRSTKLKMVMNIFNKEEMTKVFARDVMNALGLAGLNKLMLIYSHAEIARALRVIGDARNHPLMIHCASGKDRTGLICALVLACCGVSEEEIIRNYQESEKFLTPVMERIQEENALKGLDSSFDGTPREVMQETLAFINDKWGSIAEYLDEIGFSIEEQRQLASVLVPRPKRVQPIKGLKQSAGKIGQQRSASNGEDSPPEAPRKRIPPGSNLAPQGLVSGEFYAILSQGCENMLLKQAEV